MLHVVAFHLAGCLRRGPYISSSANSTHLNSRSCAFFSSLPSRSPVCTPLWTYDRSYVITPDLGGQGDWKIVRRSSLTTIFSGDTVLHDRSSINFHRSLQMDKPK